MEIAVTGPQSVKRAHRNEPGADFSYGKGGSYAGRSIKEGEQDDTKRLQNQRPYKCQQS